MTTLTIDHFQEEFLRRLDPSIDRLSLWAENGKIYMERCQGSRCIQHADASLFEPSVVLALVEGWLEAIEAKGKRNEQAA